MRNGYSRRRKHFVKLIEVKVLSIHNYAVHVEDNGLVRKTALSHADPFLIPTYGAPQPKNSASARAMPSSLLDAVTISAAALASSTALPIATPVPAQRSMDTSF